MLPERSPFLPNDVIFDFDSLNPPSIQIKEGKTLIDRHRFENKTGLIDSGLDPLLVLWREPAIISLLDTSPVSAALEAVTELTEAFQTGKAAKLSEVTARLMASVGQMYLPKDRSQYKCGGLRQTLDELSIPYSTGFNVFRDSATPPEDISLVKTFSSDLIRYTCFTDSSWRTLRAKLTAKPMVVSPYLSRDSWTLFGVGVSIRPEKIVAAFPTDINSKPTTENHSPGLARFANLPQLTGWHDIRRVSDPQIASRLNPHYRYPEIWCELPDLPLKAVSQVVIRPQDANVSQMQSEKQWIDNGRLLAAVTLSRILGNLPIRILE